MHIPFSKVLQINYLAGALIIIVFISACKKIYYYPDKDLGTPETAALAQEGGGYSPYPINTMDAVMYGLENMEGIEVDVQLSENNTLWLVTNQNFRDMVQLKKNFP